MDNDQRIICLIPEEDSPYNPLLLTSSNPRKIECSQTTLNKLLLTEESFGSALQTKKYLSFNISNQGYELIKNTWKDKNDPIQEATLETDNAIHNINPQGYTNVRILQGPVEKLNINVKKSSITLNEHINNYSSKERHNCLLKIIGFSSLLGILSIYLYMKYLKTS